jgi:hypothetical protein
MGTHDGSVVVYTTAPEDYDWSWTRTEVEHVAMTDRGKPVRRVRIEDRWHADSQKARYGSGLEIALEQPQFDAWVRHGFLTLTPDQARERVVGDG